MIFPAADLAASKTWFAQLIGHPPYFDEPFYVGFDVGGYELGLDPDAPTEDGPTTYLGVDAIETAHAKALAEGATAYKPIREVGEGIKVATVKTPDGYPLGLIENPNFKAKS